MWGWTAKLKTGLEGRAITFITSESEQMNNCEHMSEVTSIAPMCKSKDVWKCFSKVFRP